MLHFFIKSTICLVLLFAFYKLFLEREKMHSFNRFYLLSVLVLVLVIPNTTINIESSGVGVLNTIIHPNLAWSISPKILNIFLVIYLIGVVVFAARLLFNLKCIITRVIRNPHEKINDNTIILSEENILPHTFLNYVFINKTDFETNAIEAELFEHEFVHVKQKHTIDVIFIELYHIVFWFNPLIPLVKKAIKLNHEFLADQSVIETYGNPSKYQYILLDIASHYPSYSLTSNLNYSLTKQRFNMMFKQSSNRTKTILKVVLIPLILFALVSFSDVVVTKEHGDREHESSSSWFNSNEEHSEGGHH